MRLLEQVARFLHAIGRRVRPALPSAVATAAASGFATAASGFAAGDGTRVGTGPPRRRHRSRSRPARPHPRAASSAICARRPAAGALAAGSCAMLLVAVREHGRADEHRRGGDQRASRSRPGPCGCATTPPATVTRRRRRRRLARRRRLVGSTGGARRGLVVRGHDHGRQLARVPARHDRDQLALAARARAGLARAVGLSSPEVSHESRPCEPIMRSPASSRRIVAAKRWRRTRRIRRALVGDGVGLVGDDLGRHASPRRRRSSLAHRPRQPPAEAAVRAHAAARRRWSRRARARSRSADLLARLDLRPSRRPPVRPWRVLLEQRRLDRLRGRDGLVDQPQARRPIAAHQRPGSVASSSTSASPARRRARARLGAQLGSRGHHRLLAAARRLVRERAEVDRSRRDGLDRRRRARPSTAASACRYRAARAFVIEIEQHALEVQPRDRLQALEVADSRDASITSSSVRLPSISRRIRLLSSGTSPSRRRELVGVDLEAMRQRRQLLEQARPLVEPPHALHQQALRARRDHLAAAHGAEHDLELALAPGQQAIHGVLALQRAGLGVDHLAVAEVDRGLALVRSPVNWMTPDLRLISIVWITSTTGMSATRPANRVAVARAPRTRSRCRFCEQDVDPRDDLLDVDRLGQVVLDAELEAADLVLDRGLGGEEDERDLGPVGVARTRRRSSKPSSSVGNFVSEMMRSGDVQLELVERVLHRLRGRDGEPRLAQGHLQHSQAASVPVDQEQALLRHGAPTSESVA